jgi:UDP-N-acetylglucosamine--N-acetylmuramyl-(pentapeptide) pyrophosphoryl-undecaprenol N-acetylglucosamine transferase
VLAVAQALRQRRADVEFLYVGTRDGPERKLAAANDIPFAAISTGKLRRYWALDNLTDPARVAYGIFEASRLVKRFRPNLAFAAGGFAAVPPIVAARLAGAYTLIHQQDVVPGLANRLLAPLASGMTLSLASSQRHFPRRKCSVTGNPVRSDFLSAEPRLAFQHLGLDPDVPVLVATGGGTGALGLNRLVAAAAPRLIDRLQLVHLTGRGRGVPAATTSDRYRAIEFLVDDMPHLLAAATLVISRAGMGTLTELAALGRASLIVPMPGSHQWANAQAFARLGAIEVADQDALTAESLAERITSLLSDAPRRELLGATLAASMPRDAADRIASALLAHAD